MFLALPHWRPRPQHLVLEHPRFFNSLPIVISQHTTFFIRFSWKNRQEKRRIRSCISSYVKSLIEVSRSAVLCPCHCNYLRWAPCATPDSIVLHPVKQHSNRSLDAIHPLVVTTCNILLSKKQPQIRASSDWPTFGRRSWICPLIVGVIWSRIGLNNRHTIGILKSVLDIQSGPVGYFPPITGVTPNKFSNKCLKRNRLVFKTD